MIFELSHKIPPWVFDKIGDVSLDFPNQTCREEIRGLLERTVLRKGKRLRPMLTYLMGDILGLPPEQVKLYADSIELVHAASLSHDDVIDQAVTRRGMPSINTEGNKRAVLAGDFLLARVMSDLATRGCPELVKEMGDVVASLSWGEWLQMEASQKRCYDRDVLQEIALNKTAAVMTWCTVAPAIVASLPPYLVVHCRHLGREFGLAFQWMDDVLDFSSDSEKDTHSDLKNGMLNAVAYEHLELHPELKGRYEEGACPVELIVGAGVPEEAIDIVRKRAEQKLKECRGLLEVICSEIPIRQEAKGSREAIEAIFAHLSGRK